MSEWSNVVKGRTQKESFEASRWKECPKDNYGKKKYFINENNLRIATTIERRNKGYCTIIGNTPLPQNKVISFDVIISKSENKDSSIENKYIGIAPLNINQDEENNNQYNCGWYINTRDLTLVSGPPQNYRNKNYDLNNQNDHVRTIGNVGVVMDTTKGELSFILNGVNLGVACEGIPLDKPLVPCVIIKGGSVELIIK